MLYLFTPNRQSQLDKAPPEGSNEKSGLAKSIQKEKNPWSVFAAGWGISLLIHGAIALAFLLVSISSSTLLDRAKQSPQAILQPITDPLQVEPISDDLPFELVLTDETLPITADLTPVPQKLPSPSELTGNIAVLSASSPATTGKYVGRRAYQTTFCGASGNADRICFIVDCSGSMIIAFDYIRCELKRTISSFSPAQYFNVIFFAGGEPRELVPAQLLRANVANRRKALAFIDQISLTSVSNTTAAWQGVVRALQSAFQAKSFDGGEVNLIYLLTDGEFDHQQVNQAVTRMQAGRDKPVSIAVIACGNQDNEKFLRSLAETYKGSYRFISDEQLSNSGK